VASLGVELGAEVVAPTDDRPFLFFTHGWGDYFAFRSRADTHEVVGWVPVWMLGTLLWVTIAVSLGTAAWPWIARAPWRRDVAAGCWAGYFAGLGLGFLAVEALLIQVFVLVLGHPSYALTCILFSLLLAAGLGSAWAGRRWPAGRMGPVRVACLGVIGLIVALLAGRAQLFDALGGLGVVSRVVASVVVLAPLGFLMGMPFQAGLRALAGQDPAAVSWAWAVNAVTSVLGSVVAMLIALHAGFAAAAWFGAAAYALAAFAAPGGARDVL
jgi:hypothetical protein